MNKLYTIILLLIGNLLYGQNWEVLKDNLSPINELPEEFDSLYRQPLSTLGWEDGVHISDDGLNLYCTYLPVDFLSFLLNGSLPNNFSASYSRGAPTLGMDLTTNPINASEWLHSDILYAYRASVSDSFKTWKLSDMARPFYSEGAPSPVFVSNNNEVEFMLFTSNDNSTNNTDIWIINNTALNPSGIGAPLPFPVNTSGNEDNPHQVRLDKSSLILFFDSDNRPGGIGDADIWYSLSFDNGMTWSNPNNVSTVNTPAKEHQPFLFHDLQSNKWFLYYSGPNKDGKLAVFRVEQTIVNNWNSWGSPELVISAGNTAGIGEPSLTRNGDISFVVVYEDQEMNSIYNHYDADPWFLRKKSISTGVEQPFVEHRIIIYPNPASEKIYINSKKDLLQVNIYDYKGEIIPISKNPVIDIHHLLKGVYFLEVQFATGEGERVKFIKQ